MALRHREISQNVVGHLIRGPAGARATNANTQTCKLTTADLGDDRLHIMMTAGAAAGAEPHGADRQVKVIEDHNQVGRLGMKPTSQGGDGHAAAVHERLRLGQDHVLLGDAPAGNERVCFPVLKSEPVALGE